MPQDLSQAVYGWSPDDGSIATGGFGNNGSTGARVVSTASPVGITVRLEHSATDQPYVACRPLSLVASTMLSSPAAGACLPTCPGLWWMHA